MGSGTKKASRAVRWPGRILLVGCVVVLIGSMTLVSYYPNYDDRIYLANSVRADQGYDASDRHFPLSKLNADMLMIESDHDLRNATDMIAVDRVARAIFHTPGVGMVQAVTRPLGMPGEHTSFPYTIGTLGSKVKEVLPFLHDVNDRFKEISAVTTHLTDLTRRQKDVVSQQATAAHIQAETKPKKSWQTSLPNYGTATRTSTTSGDPSGAISIGRSTVSTSRSASRCVVCLTPPISSTDWPKHRPKASRRH